MRILHVNKYLYRRGGAESYMQEVASLQQGAGHEVAFFGMQHPDNDPQAYARHFPTYLELEPAPASTVGKVAGLGRMVWSTSARRGIDAVVADFEPDVVHLHSFFAGAFGRVRRPRGAAVVYQPHSWPFQAVPAGPAPLGQIAHDTALISGATPNAGGTISYALYSNADTVHPIGKLTYSGNSITDLASRVFT